MAGATLRFDVVGNAASGRKALDETGAAGERMGTRLGKAGRDADQTRGKVGRLGGAVAGAAKSFGPLAAAAGAGLVLKFGADSLKAASDTQQAFGAIDSVFGKNAQVVKGWANSAATDVGLARSEYGNLAVVLGSMLKNTGIEDYSGKTNQLIKLGADLAATYGGSVNESVAAVGSLLRGETDPIERYGVSIKQADVSARMAADGLGKLTGKAKTQAEQQTRLKLLMEQTTAAQGAFGRETDTLAGQQARLGARFTNLKDTLGQKLLPTATKVVTWLSNTVAGTNKTSAVLGSLGRTVATYVTPVVNAAKTAFSQVSTALGNASGKGNSASKTLGNIGKVAGPLANLMRDHFANSVKTAGLVLSALITSAGGVARVIGSIVGAVDRAIGALGRLREKASISIPNPLSGVGGLFRSAPSLIRAGGIGFAAGSSSPVVRFTSAPQIVVRLDERRLRGFVSVMIQDQLADVFGAVQAGVNN